VTPLKNRKEGKEKGNFPPTSIAEYPSSPMLSASGLQASHRIKNKIFFFDNDALRTPVNLS